MFFKSDLPYVVDYEFSSYIKILYVMYCNTAESDILKRELLKHLCKEISECNGIRSKIKIYFQKQGLFLNNMKVNILFSKSNRHFLVFQMLS